MKPAAFFIFVAFACCFVDCSILTKREAEEQQCGQKGGSADNGDHQDRTFEGGFRFRRFNLGAQIGYGIKDAGDAGRDDGAFVLSGRNVSGCDSGAGSAGISSDCGIGGGNEFIADQRRTLHAPGHIGQAQGSAILLYSLIDVRRIISIEAGVVLGCGDSVGAALVAGCLRLDRAMVQRQSAGRNAVVELDRGLQLCEDIFEVLTGSCDSDDLGVQILFLKVLLFFDDVTHGVQEAIMLEVLFIEICRVLVGQERIGLDRKLLPVEILIGHIVRNVRCCACSYRHGHGNDENKHQGSDFFLLHGS